MGELAFTVGYIADDLAKAQKWMAHDDIDGFKRARDMLTSGLHRAKLSEERLTEREWDQYKWLCMLKHGNPIVFLSFGFLIQHADEHTIRGAYGALAERYLSRFVLACAVEYMLLALSLLTKYHLRGNPTRFKQLIELQHAWKTKRDADVVQRIADFPPPESTSAVLQKC